MEINQKVYAMLLFSLLYLHETTERKKKGINCGSQLRDSDPVHHEGKITTAGIPVVVGVSIWDPSLLVLSEQEAENRQG